MRFSVIIPFYNAAATLTRCLAGLERQALDGVEYILVDNDSRDGSAGLVREFMERHPDFNMRLLTEKRPGASAARNAGARAAAAPWLVFTDADCVPAADWLADLSSEIDKAGDVGALAGCIQPEPAVGVVEKFMGLYTLPSNKTDRLYDHFELGGHGGFPTANLAVRRSLFKALGGFDETLPIYGEDHDLCRRIYGAGFKIKALTGAVVYHIHRNNISAMIRQARGFGGAHAWKLVHAAPAGTWVVQAPGIHFRRTAGRMRVWLDLNQADKKMMLALAAGLFWPPLFCLPPLYYLYLAVSVGCRMRRRGQPVRWKDVLAMPALLLIKSGALSWGRIRGSVKCKVICV